MSIDNTQLDELRIDRGSDKPGAPRPAWIVGGVVVVLILGALLWLAVRPARASVRVASAQSVRSEGRSSILNATGYVTARRQATVSSKNTGKVTEVFAEEGMHVEPGQVMARLDDAIPAAALRLAKAQEDAARSSLEETRVRIEEARLDMTRATNLTQQQISSRADLDHARAALQALQAHLLALQDSLTVAQREVHLRQQDVDDAVIRAPFAGIVVSKNAQPGEMISPISAGGGFTRTGICTIVDMSSLEIEVDVNEAYINRVQPQQPVEAVLDAYPDWRIPSHVITVIPTADRQKATVKVRIGFDAKDPRILPDMGVKVSFIETAASGSQSKQTAVEVPKSALRRDGEQDIVLVVKDERIERRAVRVAATEGERARIASGIAEGESVVIDGPAELKEGDRVSIAKEKKS